MGQVRRLFLLPFFLLFKCSVERELKLQISSRDIISQEEEACVADTSTMIEKLFKLENSAPLAFQNKATFAATKQQWFTFHEHKPYVNSSSRLDEHEVMANIYAYLQISSQVHTKLLQVVSCS